MYLLTENQFNRLRNSNDPTIEEVVREVRKQEEKEKSHPLPLEGESLLSKQIISDTFSKVYAQARINDFNIYGIESILPGNPFLSDPYHMGHHIGTNLTIMMENFSENKCKYIILINTETGKRIQIKIGE